MVTGIVFGLGAALFQSVSYLFSAIFIAHYKSGATSHLIMVHMVIGLITLMLLPFIWHPLIMNLGDYWLPLIGASSAYLFGQYSLYQAIQHSVASRVSPLLGLKVLVLAVIGTLFLGNDYYLTQWAAVGLCVSGAIWLGMSGGRISRQALGWVIAACVGYALSDLSIFYLIQQFSSLTLMSATIISVSLCYLLCGLGCLFFLPRLKQPRLLVASTPAAISWFLAMCCLFACFAEIGVVFGGIVQSSRGLISILLAVLIAGLGLSFADPLPPRRVLLQRFAAAALMTVAIALFSIESIPTA